MQDIKDYYWETLRKASALSKEMEKKKDEPQESKQVYAIAFACLIKHGARFEISTNQDEISAIIAENNKNKGLFTGGTQKEVPELKESISITNMDGTEYICDLGAVRQVLGKDYTVYIEKPAPQDENLQEFDTVELPDIDEAGDDAGADIRAREKEESINGPAADKNSRMSEDRIPEFRGDSRYNRDPDGEKSLSTFCYTEVTCTVSPEDGSEPSVLSFFVYPLDFKENTSISDIAVAAKYGDAIRSAVSRGKTSSVKLDFTQLEFVVRGKWEDSEFKVQVQPMAKKGMGKFRVSCESEFYLPEKRTFSTYAMAMNNEITYNLFPAEIAQNSLDGFCACVAIRSVNGEVDTFSPTEEGSFMIGDTVLSAWWTAGEAPVLHYEFSG